MMNETMAEDKANSRRQGLRVSELAEKAGVSKQTVEYYVLLGLLHPERNPETGRRRFCLDDVRRIRLIRKLNRSGYPLREIREIWLRKK